jgi:hypothetical protein
MGLDLWFPADLERILASKNQVAQRFGGEYRTGYIDALSDLAIEFGINLPGSVRWVERPPMLERELVVEGEVVIGWPQITDG